jgi:hypothetical protein
MHPNTLTQANIIALQRMIGNGAVSQLFAESKNTNQNVNNRRDNNDQSAANTVSTKQSGDEKPIVQMYKPSLNQDEVQKYLAGIVPSPGPIRDYIENHASKNSGLCAGWVVLHCKSPKKLIEMWEKVSRAIENNKNDLGINTDEAVKMYIEA